MGRKGKWFSAVKRAFIPQCCQGNPKESLDNSKVSNSLPIKEVETTAGAAAQLLLPAPIAEAKLIENGDEHNKHAYSVALASAVAAEAAAVAAQAAAEVARLTTSATRQTGESSELIAAIKIQSAYRGYQARRTTRTLRGLNRLKRVLDGAAVKSQTRNALQCMQTMARVQAQIHSRRVRMTEENQALQRHLQRKHEKELEKVKIAEEWDDSLQSKEKIEAKLLNKQEAAIRRERTLAYAFSHQWRSSSKSLTPVFTEPSNPQWGWSWLGRWMAARPWENQSTKEINDHASIKSASCSFIVRTTKQHDTSLERTPSAAQKSSRPSGHRSPATPRCMTPSVASRKKSESPRGRRCSVDDDSRSMLSVQSERRRRFSIAGSSIGDDESLGSSTVPSYMASTESARARSRCHSPVCGSAGTPEKGSVRSSKKRLSFPSVDKSSISSTANLRRFSGPPKLGISPVKDLTTTSEEQIANN
ncbi:protein IQ-DOMAIN 3-like [Curcuma longa]|uniref:protein IQ-DOMAIN 3-like n=1 Tax=Curcuma longa TaxID=136217 RepID=UPI003D9EF4BA